ncbi:Hypothetical predicted protein [Cloeon dipterum]|uniref:Lipase domain-containing protein n=1 Tax=Cloeon dipterum TaxID=197152 RepID=A0A8S1C9G8_9INSE|nr:Hypothetical predicted protein [Cloeon dipterum]
MAIWPGPIPSSRGPSGEASCATVQLHCSQIINQFTFCSAAYAARGGYNFVTVGWRPLAGGPFYHSAVENVGPLGYQIAQMLDFMEKNAGPLKDLHLIGNNLGAHAMGVAARRTYVVRVPRITGFDPAMANISNFPLEQRLDPGDAYFVDVIDTDSPSEKRPHDFGHANFYISRAKPTKCHVPRILRFPSNYYRRAFCGHGRAFEVYARSVLHENAFPAMHCASYTAFRQGLCRDPSEAVPMGFKAPNSARGNYFLFNEKQLFGLGNALGAQQTSNQIGLRRSAPPTSASTNGYLVKQIQDFLGFQRA